MWRQLSSLSAIIKAIVQFSSEKRYIFLNSRNERNGDFGYRDFNKCERKQLILTGLHILRGFFFIDLHNTCNDRLACDCKNKFFVEECSSSLPLMLASHLWIIIAVAKMFSMWFAPIRKKILIIYYYDRNRNCQRYIYHSFIMSQR